MTHKVIQQDIRNIRQEHVTRDVHSYDVYHRVLPVIDVEVLPARHYMHHPDGTCEEISAPDGTQSESSAPDETRTVISAPDGASTEISAPDHARTEISPPDRTRTDLTAPDGTRTGISGSEAQRGTADKSNDVISEIFYDAND